jgi:hypothetical protein
MSTDVARWWYLRSVVGSLVTNRGDSAMTDPLAVTLTIPELKALVADAVRDALGASQNDELIDQRASPLGVRRHGDAVRRRIAEGLPGATRIGRRWCLSRSALNEELARLGRVDPAAAPSAAERLRAELAR